MRSSQKHSLEEVEMLHVTDWSNLRWSSESHTLHRLMLHTPSTLTAPWRRVRTGGLAAWRDVSRLHQQVLNIIRAEAMVTYVEQHGNMLPHTALAHNIPPCVCVCVWCGEILLNKLCLVNILQDAVAELANTNYFPPPKYRMRNVISFILQP